jgi:hypothetical protein
MVILNNGCSFSALTRDSGTTSYCDFLPKEVHNIAMPGSGVEINRVKTFINNKHPKIISNNHLTIYDSYFGDKELTHFIYQIPHPARQPLLKDLTDEEFYKATLQIDEVWDIRSEDHPVIEKYKYNGKPRSLRNILVSLGLRYKSYKANHKVSWDKELLMQQEFLWHQLWHENKIFGLEERERYLKKALNGVNENVNMIRNKWPNAKIIFLRYEETKIPLIYEYGKDWFKNTLSNYCKDNNVTYIYEKNFNTNWFKHNNLCADGKHPNEAGAKLIADKIKEYL